MTEKEMAYFLGYNRVYWNNEAEHLCSTDEPSEEALQTVKDNHQNLYRIAKFLFDGDGRDILDLKEITVDNDIVECVDTACDPNEVGDRAIFIVDFKKRTVNAKINYSYQKKNYYLKKMRSCPENIAVFSYFDREWDEDERESAEVSFFVVNWEEKRIWTIDDYAVSGAEKIKFSLFYLIEKLGSVDKAIEWMLLQTEYNNGKAKYYKLFGRDLSAGFK